MTYNDICREIIVRNGIATLAEIVNDALLAFRTEGLDELVAFLSYPLANFSIEDKSVFAQHIADLSLEGVHSVNF